MTLPFDFQGDPALGEAIAAALEKVIDPEMSLGILSLGLVYSVDAAADPVRVRMTMTSAACPVIDMIVAEVEASLHGVLPAARDVAVDVVWQPAWDPSRMDAQARFAMGWD